MHGTHYLGAHCSAAGGAHRAVERIREVGGTALQFFSKNQRQWDAPPLEAGDIRLFRSAWRAWGPYPVVVHDSYLVNLASPDEGQRTRSISAFARELERCALLGVQLLVTHPGAHKGQGVAAGLRTYVRALDEALRRAQAPEVRVLLETTSGQGTVLGKNFEELAAIIEASRLPERLGVCLDTCHVFAAGYDLRSKEGCLETLERLDAALGLERLGLLHLNDSKHPFASTKDRHEHIGRGELGLTPFRVLVNDARLARVPMVIETPKDKAGLWDKMNLAVLRGAACPWLEAGEE